MDKKHYFTTDDISISDLKELGECITDDMSIGALQECIDNLIDETVEKEMV